MRSGGLYAGGCQARRHGLRGDGRRVPLGTIDVAARYHADAALIAEPTELVIAHKGFVWLEVEVQCAAIYTRVIEDFCG